MKVIVTWATWYVWEGVLLECITNPEVEKVLSVSRKPCGHKSKKLEEYIVKDFMDLPENDPKLKDYDAVFFCAWISSVGVSDDVYKVISHDIPLHFAKAFWVNKNKTYIYVSWAWTGTSKQNRWKVKRSTEEELQKLSFKQVFLFRPGIMIATKWQKHFTNFWAKSYRYFSWFWRLFKWFTNEMYQVWRSMINVTKDWYKTPYIEVKDIHELSN